MRRTTWWTGALLLLAGMALAAGGGCRSGAPVRGQAAGGPAPAPTRTASHEPWLRQASDYPWTRTASRYEPLIARCPTPAGYTRATVAPKSWGEWLRYLPLLPPGTPVRVESGQPVVAGSSPELAGVVDLDVRRDQECADVIFRLRAEYLRWAGREAEISFPADNIHLSWSQWQRGVRPHQVRGRLTLERSATPSASRASFDRYLASVYAWSGTYSIADAGRPAKYAKLRPGDYLVHAGDAGCGHVVLIADVMRDTAGHAWALILQGYKPAQSAHVLAPGNGSPWFALDPTKPVVTPGWPQFEWTELREIR